MIGISQSKQVGTPVDAQSPRRRTRELRESRSAVCTSPITEAGERHSLCPDSVSFRLSMRFTTGAP